MNGFEVFKLDHPSLGRLTGRKQNDDVLQFRSIPYAHVPARFRQAVMLDDLSPEQRVCTHYTYACPQSEQTMEPFGGPVLGEDDRRYDEFECLNLTVTVPAALLNAPPSKKVPVMVYVHGGGLAQGAHYGAVHEMTRMVSLSCKESNPVIIVSIHYRLNFLGLLACQDLIDDAAKYNEPPCNFALFDQRLAFLWVHKHIAGFGGDASRITAFGESAGSASLCFQMSSTVPLFKRVILQSGSASTISPTPLSAERETLYKAILSFCGIDENDPQRLEKLRHDVPVAKIIGAGQALLKAAYTPLAHETFFPTSPNYTNQNQILSQCPWVEEVIIGDAVYEGYLFSQALQRVRPQDFLLHVQKALGSENAATLLNLYQISAKMDQNLFWTRLCVFCGDAMFSLPCHTLSRSFAQSSKKTYRYSLSLRNPFPGSIFSEVLGHHFIELLYMFMTLMDRYPQPKQREISVSFARYWIAFANGRAPWTAFTLKDETLAVADSQHGWITRTRKEDVESQKEAEGGGERRYTHWETLDGILKKLGDDAPKAVAELSFPALISLAQI